MIYADYYCCYLTVTRLPLLLLLLLSGTVPPVSSGFSIPSAVGGYDRFYRFSSREAMKLRNSS